MPLQARQASDDVLAGLDYTRFFQDVESSGDIYEFNTSARAFQLGPLSDLSDYNVWYMDKMAGPLQLNYLRLSVGNPWIGRLDALNSQEYPTTRLPGFVMITSRDLVDPLFVPSGYSNVIPDIIVRYPVRLDVVGFHAEPSAVAPIRSDKLTPINQIGGVDGQNLWHVFPYYGRKQGTFSLTNFGAGDFAFDVIGVRLGLGDSTGAGTPQRHSEFALTGTPVSVPPGETRQVITRASEDGPFDLIVARLPGTGVANNPNLFADFYVSDTES